MTIGLGDGVAVVAEGVLMISRAAVNCYLVATDDGPVLIDAGLPGSRPLLDRALDAQGVGANDLAAIVLTHGHFDHVGMADGIAREHSVDVHVHPADERLARHPDRYAHEAARTLYPVRFPAAIPTLARMTLAGALGVRGVTSVADVSPGADLPGGLQVIPSPGHTAGHCAFFDPTRGILFSGDALVTWDPYTGQSGPRLVARAATADSTQAAASLDALADTGADIVLPGHGAPYRSGVRRAVDRARAVGIA